MRRPALTIHLMEERLDAGPILAQQGEPVPDGMTEAALEARLATLGGELLVQITRRAGRWLGAPTTAGRGASHILSLALGG